MRRLAATTIVVLSLSCLIGATPKNPSDGDPCSKVFSNVEMRECYSKEQVRANVKTDLLANKIAAQFLDEARDPLAGPEIAGALRKAAAGVKRSQNTWKEYRDQHCGAVADSWTTGSGAGTAYEECLFRLGRTRLEELQADFPESHSN